MRRLAAAALTLTLTLAAAAPAHATTPADAPISLTPYDPAQYTDLYANPDGAVTGSTYIFNPTADFPSRISYDFAHMRAQGINTIGFYNLVQLTDADRDTVFDNLEANHQKAVVRIESYDSTAFAFDAFSGGHRDADNVVNYYDSDDTVHGYTALLAYLVRTHRLGDIAYFAVNMPVDDGGVANRFATARYPDGRSNPLWAASQPPYADYLLSRLRAILGTGSTLYLSVFYGWDQSYPTPSYAGIAHPADGYFLNNYSYPIADPPDETAPPATLIDQPRLQTAMDKLMAQYPTQPVVVEYGFHTLAYDNGVTPNQTAGLVTSIEAKRLALLDTTAYYRDGSSNGHAFRVRGTLYFAQNLYDQEGTPPAGMDWTLDYPTESTMEAEDARYTRYTLDGREAPLPVLPEPGASGGAALTLYDLDATSVLRLRYRATHPTDLLVSVNGAVPRTVRLPAAASWRVADLAVDVPAQGSVTLAARTAGTVLLDSVQRVADYQAELAASTGAVHYGGTVTGLELPAGRPAALWFAPVRGGTRVAVRYAAAAPVRVRLAAATPATGTTAATVDLPATGGDGTYATTEIPLAVPTGARLTLTRETAGPDLEVDLLRVDGQYEAESTGGLYNGAHAVPMRSASEGAAATAFDVPGASVVFRDVAGGTRLAVRYAATRDASLTILGAGPDQRLAFPATGGRFAVATATVTVPAGGTLILQRNPGDSALGLTLDWASLAG